MGSLDVYFFTTASLEETTDISADTLFENTMKSRRFIKNNNLSLIS